MRGGWSQRVLCAWLFLSLKSIFGFAQAVNYAQLHGTVTDPSGAAIVGAHIKAAQTSTGLIRSTTSGPEGNFSLPNLPVGPYTLEVTSQGFQDYLQTGINLEVSQNARLDVSLKVGSVAAVEEVRSDAVMLNTTETSVGEVIDQQRIVDLPLDGRQLTQLLLLSGAATNPILPGQDLLSSKNYGNGNATSQVLATISVAGGQENSNTYLLDGGDHNDKFSNLNIPIPFPDAMQEFSVQTSTLTAQYGEHAGSVVSLVTKSGTNSFHGDIFEFLRNDAVNAHHFDFPNFVTGASQPLNPNDNALRRNQFGGTLGGPIKSDKVLFFLGYQATRNFQMPAPSTVKVPTPQALASGDFSSLESAACQSNGKARTITNPFTNKAFTKAQVPTNLFNQQALALLKFVPTSTDPCGNISLAIPDTGDEDQGITRVDWLQSPKNTVFGRYFITDFRDPPVYNGDLITTTRAGQFSRAQSVVLGDTYTLSPSMVNSVHATGTRVAVFRGPSNTVPNPGALGINVPSPISGALVVSISNYFNVEGGSATPGHFDTNSFQVADDFNWIRGKHQFAFGADWVHAQLNELSTFQSNGQFAFGTGGTGSSGDALVDFLLGDVQSLTQGNPEQENWRQDYYGLYFQDNYRVRHNLTLNGGVRWEPYFPAQDRYHRGSHFDPAAFAAGTTSSVFTNAPPGLFFCGDAQTPCSYVNRHIANFSPRAGFNWDPRGKGRETIRAGYGLFYDNPEEFYFDRFADDSPFGSASIINRPVGGLTNPYQGQKVPGFPLPFPTSATNAFFAPGGIFINLPLNLRPTYVQQWNLAVEKQFSHDWLLTASYIGNRANHLWLGYDANAPVFIPGSDCSANSAVVPVHGTGNKPCSTTANEQARRPLFMQNPATGALFSSITQTSDEGNASYNALLVTARHRFSQNFTILANYTWSHCIDLGEFTGELTASRLFADPNNFSADRGNCGFDLRQNFNLSFVAGSPKFGNRLARIVAGNWLLSGIMTYHTGLWFSAVSGNDNSLTGIKQDRADLVAGQNASSGGACPDHFDVGSIGCWFNTAAFAANPAGTFGTSSRDMLNGPGFFDFDMGLGRTFPVRERQSLMVRFEAFNLLNHPNFGLPNNNQSNGAFGQITTTVGNPRTLQLAAKYIF
ncbi:MAG TPA: TonB-dependent receptor [Candidatus Angelobacter sp.]|nr:TonB-dependent receptor [Candidatus Angelobacter sp.]